MWPDEGGTVIVRVEESGSVRVRVQPIGRGVKGVVEEEEESVKSQ